MSRLDDREIVTIAGLSERKVAYTQALQKSRQVEKTKVPVFKVEDGCLEGSFSHRDGGFEYHGEDTQEEKGKEAKRNVEDGSLAGDASSLHMSLNEIRPSGFFGASSTHLDFEESLSETSNGFFGATMDELGLDPDKPKAVLQEEESATKKKFADLLSQFESSIAQMEEEGEQATGIGTGDSFDEVQKRYLDTVEQLRPSEFKPEKYEGPAETAFSTLKKDYDQEATKQERFGALQDRWHDYEGAAQDNRWYECCAAAQDLPDMPQRDPLESDNEHQIDEKEEEIAIQWIGFTEMVVERAEKIKAESDDDLSIDEDMTKWREEARRLKADTATRKETKRLMLERRRRRRENAIKRHKEHASERGSGSRRRERNDARRDSEMNSRRREEEELRRRIDENDDSSDADGSVEEDEEEEEEETTTAVADPIKICEADHEKMTEHKEEPTADRIEVADEEPVAKNDGDKKREKENKKKKKSPKKEKKDPKQKKKDKKDKDNEKEKDDEKENEKEKASAKDKQTDIVVSTSTGPSNPCGKDDDLTDGPEERNPRHLDGSPWKNPLNFWTNKPKKLNETGAKYILKTLPRTDCFRRTERSGNDNASFYWFKTEGDFDVIVKIKGNFRSSYDKAGIMLRENERTWVLSGIEYFNGELNHSTCITRGISDWSLSPVPTEAKDGLWICVKRTEGKVECFFSLDVRKWVQTRQGLFTDAKTLKVGIAAACPMGEPFKVVFERFRVKGV